MKVSSLIQAAGVRPGAGRWVVEFGDEHQTEADSPRGEYLAVRQESRGVPVPRRAETPGKGPQTGGRIIKFRAREKAGISPTSGENRAVLQKSRRMRAPGCIKASG